MNKHGSLIRLFVYTINFSFNSSSQLQEFLIKSNSYRIQSVLNRINQSDQLKREVALLYGKVYLPNKL